MSAITNTTGSLNYPYRFEYRAGERMRERIMPVKKDQCIGRGNGAEGVYNLNKEKLLRKNPNSPLLSLIQDLAVKVGNDFDPEFQIGNSLSHKSIVKSHALFTRLPRKSKGETRQFLVMDRVHGLSMNAFLPNIARKIHNDVIQQMIVSYRDCCLYLFDKGIAWADINNGNIMLEDETNELKLIDFRFWHKESNPGELTIKLLLGSLEGVGWILKSSKLRSRKESGEKVLPFIFPESFFGGKVELWQVFSAGIELYRDNPLLNACFKRIENFGDNRERLKSYLESYFEAVQGLLNAEFSQE